MKKNIIFDLDGTLIDSMHIWAGVGKRYLLKNGITPPENINEIFKTMSFTESNGYFKKEYGLKHTPEEMVAEISAMVKESYENGVKLKPFVYEFLLNESAKGTKMCLLTASEMSYVMPAIKNLGLEQFFSAVHTCTSLKMSKSTGHIYSVVAEKMGMEKEETAVFEDAYHAVINAKKEGFYVVAVEDFSAFDKKQEIKEAADKYIVTFAELI